MTAANTLKSIAVTMMIVITLTMLRTTSKRDSIHNYDHTGEHDEELLRSTALNRLTVLKSTSPVHR